MFGQVGLAVDLLERLGVLRENPTLPEFHGQVFLTHEVLRTGGEAAGFDRVNGNQAIWRAELRTLRSTRVLLEALHQVSARPALQQVGKSAKRLLPKPLVAGYPNIPLVRDQPLPDVRRAPLFLLRDANLRDG